MAIRHFEKFKEIAYQIAVEENKLTHHLEQVGDELLVEYLKTGCIRKRPLEMLNTHYYSFVPIIEFLLKKRKADKRVKSPVEKKEDSSWMTDASFCFMNIRGTGITPETTGDFINAAKILPALRVNSIHLAPFFECALEIIYGVDSLSVIDENAVNGEFLKRGMTAEEQVRFFVDVAHLYKKTVGFDIEPHTSQFSRTAIENPGFFRWLKLDETRDKLFGGLTQEKMLKQSEQDKIYQEIISIKNSVLQENNLSQLEEKGKGPETKKAHMTIIKAMIEAGIWALPCHTWKGAGLPKFAYYETKKQDCQYPEFTYIATDGENHREHAFGTLTPFKFYDGLPLNRIPKKDETPVLNKETLRYFKNIFPNLYNQYHFDFIRFDYVDHVFDSVTDKKGKLPVSDRLTPFILEKTVKKARKECGNYIGAMAERMGDDIEDYASAGFDLILGTDVLRKIEPDFVADVIQQNKKLHKLNTKTKQNVSIQFAVDSHDTGHPLFQLTPMSLYGRKGVALRLFLARFGGAGKGIRPKYEVIGNQDGSVGLYTANNKIGSIEWANNKSMNDTYHNIEDLYDEYYRMLKKGALGKIYSPDKRAVYWHIDGKDYRMICVVNTSKSTRTDNLRVEGAEKFQKAVIIDPYTGEKETLIKPIIEKLTPLSAKIIVLND